ncbi:MAG: zinc-dependent metalloprotease [Planctomycetaceae bacterium]|nr:zinc-dependent metalloprotease [Planctomycetaceae bacterium]
MRRILVIGWITALAVAVGSGGLRADDDDAPAGDDHETTVADKADGGTPKKGDAEKKFRDFAEVTKGAEKIEGFFILHHKDEHLYAEIKPSQLDQPMLAPIAIARGMAMAGQPLNFGDEWVLLFKRVGDKVQLTRRNVHYKAPAHSPLEKAVKQNYSDSILLALPIISINTSGGNSVVIDLADVFFTNFAELPFGNLDRNRTTWSKIKAFPNNIELEVEATFDGGGRDHLMVFDDGVADRRGQTIVIHYSLAKLPDSSYKPRHADDRVGHFLSALKDFGSDNPDTNFVRQINRWRIERSDPKAKLSPPKKQLIWYVESTVPLEYRPYVESGILEWNKAFEKIGIRNALAVRWQEDERDVFDPEDINYCTFRWITTGMTFAMSSPRANPLTGEMIDGDVIFDANWIRYWKDEYAFLTGTTPSSGRGDLAPPTPLAMGHVISPILAAKQGFGLNLPVPPRDRSLDPDRQSAPRVQALPAEANPLLTQLRRRQASGLFTGCQYCLGLRPEMALAAIALAERDKGADSDDKEDEDGEKKDHQAKDEPKLPQEFLGQLIKEVVMHEVGHSLGLRHNFKASAMLDADQLNDTSITRVKGMTSSVMDYNPINIAPKGQKQGDYTTTMIGPYDYWAIEYAYKPIEGDEAAELKKIAARSPDPDLRYATDEDMFLDNDPQVNVYDLGSDTLRFAKDRILLASDLLKDLDARVVKDGESWSRVRHAFGILLAQWGNAAHLASEQIGGQLVSRDHKGDKGAKDPIIPVSGAKQRESLAFLAEHILSDKAFNFSPALLRRLASERWDHWGNERMLVFGGGVDYPIYEEILGIQKIVLGRCLDAGVLKRLQNQELESDPDAEPLRIAEVFRSLTDTVWTELPKSVDGKKPSSNLSTIRRNLQREHLARLSRMVLGHKRSPFEDMYGFILFFGLDTSVPADARSLARMHLKEISGRIDNILRGGRETVDDTSRAHLEECQQRIHKVLNANLDLNEP